jgi:transcriptional regulator with XRE-family HTH domain
VLVARHYNWLHPLARRNAESLAFSSAGGDTLPYMSDMPRGVAYPLYEQVRREMALKGWTATRLRKESGVARSTLAKWATQPRPPLASTVVSVADALGIGREAALRLAGVLDASPPPVIPEMSLGDRQEVLRYGQRESASSGAERRGA